MLGLLSIAVAAPPFDVGAQEPLPEAPTALAIHEGRLLALTSSGAKLRTDQGWVDTSLPGGNVVVEDDGALIVCGPTGVVRHAALPTTLSEVPCLDLVAHEDGWWAMTEEGVVTLPGGAPVDLAPVAEHLVGHGHWVAEHKLFPSDVPQRVFPGVTDSGWLDDRLLLLHPERKLLGRIGPEGIESAWSLPFAAHHLVVGDLGRDGVLDVVVADDTSFATLTFTDTSPPPPAPRPVVRPTPVKIVPQKKWVPPQTTSLLGLQMPNFAGLAPDPEFDALFIGGFGIAAGDSIGGSEMLVAFSPAAAGGVERGSRRFRSYLGADSAPLFIWNNPNGAGIHLAMVTAGFTIGSDRLRFGPIATAGLLGVGAGVRGVFTPFEGRDGKLTGLEGRLTWLSPSTAQAALYYVSAVPMGRRGNDKERPERRASLCSRFGFALGAAGGVSSTESAWEFVGRDTPYQLSGSPAAALSCESGSKRAGWVMGLETAPYFFYRVPVSEGGADQKLQHHGSLTAGLWTGSDHIRFGPVGTVGVWTLGAGVRAVVTPFHTPKGAWHGLELRATALFPSTPSFQGMALYHIWFDPKSTR